MCQKKIMRKRSHESFDDGPPRKKFTIDEYVAPKKVAYGEILTDLNGKKWKVGKAIGHGGFGDIYLVTDQLSANVKQNAPYVVKIESHSNGPLFVEINCFIRIAKSQKIEQWKKSNKMEDIGMPNYIASGSHKIGDEKLRFLILPRYEMDLEKILNKNNNRFNLKTVVNIGIQILDILEYIHSCGFVHCDIKASNILYCSSDSNNKNVKESCHKTELNNNYTPIDLDYTPTIAIASRREHKSRQCNKRRLFNHEPRYSKPTLRRKKSINYNEDLNSDIFEDFIDQRIDEGLKSENSENSNKNGKVYLMDYGLATKYINSDGSHRQYCNDERKAHAGTLMFCSLDAHMGAQSRRSDLECLGYNMIYWLTSKLPWENLMDNPELVEREKKKNFLDLDKFLKYCFDGEYPDFIFEYFYYIRKLTFEEKPNYKVFKNVLKSALKEYGYIDDMKFDFENLEGWGRKQKSNQFNQKIISHKNSNSPFIQRQPLISNSPIIKKIVLRPKTKKNKSKKMNWSKILSSDPEKLLKRPLLKEDLKPKPKVQDACETPLQNLDLFKLNPTYAMREVYAKCQDSNNKNNFVQNLNGSKFGRGDSSAIPETRAGYTPAMNLVLAKMRERKFNEQMEFFNSATNGPPAKKSRVTKSQPTSKKADSLRKVQSQVSGIKEKETNKKLKVTRVTKRQGLRG